MDGPLACPSQSAIQAPGARSLQNFSGVGSVRPSIPAPRVSSPAVRLRAIDLLLLLLPYTAQTAVRTSITTGTPPGSILTATPRTICPARRPAMISGQRVSERSEHKTQKTATGPRCCWGWETGPRTRGDPPTRDSRKLAHICATAGSRTAPHCCIITLMI
ncbi:hypothetical protein PCL_09804 [Purpureocillium lilacinum]|uniref:Uncharacterized protein n=1 Tax=Purpureocillium lilacinum TaxID=33203 RepID=A0A2U3EE51_PURLI|nr:hypothetical protein PCL_09804 [Purpureocillium lilacinum]